MLCELESRLWELLKLNPDGISEYHLIRLLQKEMEEEFAADLFRNELDMYRAHFLLFHALYRLSDHLLEHQQGQLEIHVLKIIILPSITHKTRALSHPDPLREHYLNLDNLSDTTLEDVKTLLGKFWTNYYADQKKPQALKVMGLKSAASRVEIERRYRTLAMQHHPDRGGDEQEFLKLQQAIKTLRQCDF
jgi:DnaJ-domain-containing protein 1